MGTPAPSLIKSDPTDIVASIDLAGMTDEQLLAFSDVVKNLAPDAYAKAFQGELNREDTIKALSDILDADPELNTSLNAQSSKPSAKL